MSQKAMQSCPHSPGGNGYVKRLKARLRRRKWKQALLDGREPRDANAYDGRYDGYVS